MKGVEGKTLTIMISVVFMVIAVIVIWLVLSGYLKFGTKLSGAALKGLCCGVFEQAPGGKYISGVLCGGC